MFLVTTLAVNLKYLKRSFVLLLITAPFVTTTSSCASNLLVRVSNATGLIQSQSDGSWTYNNNMDCSWSLSSNAILELAFASFNTYSSADCLTVYDGDSPSSPLIGRFSGSSLPATITSTSNKLYVRFISDGSDNDFGFRASYRGMLLISSHILLNSCVCSRNFKPLSKRAQEQVGSELDKNNNGEFIYCPLSKHIMFCP